MFTELSALTIVMYIVAILISLTIHEMMHAFTGLKLGDDTAAEEGRISLNPIRHIDPIMTLALPIATIVLFGSPILAAKPVPFNPARVKWDEFGAALIAFAGPASNLVLAILGAILAKFVAGGTLVGDFIGIFVVLNVALFVFNLIPIPPLDGSRVLYAFAPEPVRRIMEQLEPVGFFIIIALVLLGGFGGTLGNINQFVLNLLP